MALVSSAMAFSWSKWNADIDDRERIFLRAAELTTDEPLIEVRARFPFVVQTAELKLGKTGTFLKEFFYNSTCSLFPFLQTLSAAVWRRKS